MFWNSKFADVRTAERFAFFSSQLRFLHQAPIFKIRNISVFRDNLIIEVLERGEVKMREKVLMTFVLLGHPHKDALVPIST